MRWLTISMLLFAVTFGVQANTSSDEKDRSYYPSGTVHFEYARLGGRLHGTTREYYETGELKTEAIYKEGRLESQREFLRNGKLSSELRMVSGRRHETQIQYYPTGELFREYTLIDGVREGTEIDYYQNGRKKAERRYVNGRREGNAKGYHNNGNLQGDWEFKSDVPVGATIYYRSGEKWLDHSAFDEKGRLNGISYEYGRDGGLIARRFYENNQMIRRERIDGLAGRVMMFVSDLFFW